jgi:hypothetical protein
MDVPVHTWRIQQLHVMQAAEPDRIHIIGLVTLGSATATDLADDVDTVRLGGLHHMELLNTPRVYRHIHDWLATPE